MLSYMFAGSDLVSFSMMSLLIFFLVYFKWILYQGNHISIEANVTQTNQNKGTLAMWKVVTETSSIEAPFIMVRNINMLDLRRLVIWHKTENVNFHSCNSCGQTLLLQHRLIIQHKKENVSIDDMCSHSFSGTQTHYLSQIGNTLYYTETHLLVHRFNF